MSFKRILFKALSSSNLVLDFDHICDTKFLQNDCMQKKMSKDVKKCVHLHIHVITVYVRTNIVCIIRKWSLDLWRALWCQILTHPFGAEFTRGRNYYMIFYHFQRWDGSNVLKCCPNVVKHKGVLILHIREFWWHDNARSQTISSHSVEPLLLEYSAPNG